MYAAQQQPLMQNMDGSTFQPSPMTAHPSPATGAAQGYYSVPPEKTPYNMVSPIYEPSAISPASPPPPSPAPPAYGFPPPMPQQQQMYQQPAYQQPAYQQPTYQQPPYGYQEVPANPAMMHHQPPLPIGQAFHNGPPPPTHMAELSAARGDGELRELA